MNIEPWAQALRVQKWGCRWLPEVRLGYQGVSYWMVPWGTTQAEAGVEAEPDDGR